MSPPARSDRLELPVLWSGEPEAAASAFDLRRALRLTIAMLGLLLILAAFVPIGGAVLGAGQVGVETRVKRIAHPFGGVIAAILVANGEHVAKGQLLMRLDDKVTGADAIYANLTVEQLLAQRARLEAERLGTASIAFPIELTRARTVSAVKAMTDERALFSLRNSEQSQLLAQLTSQVSQLGNEIVGINAQITSLDAQRVLIEPERRGIKNLYERGLVTIGRRNQMERTAVDIDGRIGALQAQIAQANGRASEIRSRIIQLGETRRLEAGTQLGSVLTALNEQQTRSVSAGDEQARTEIRAPAAGTVEKIAFAAKGEVVRPAEPIMEIVPNTDEMLVEVSINPSDIDQVRTGQPARVRFSAFNVASTPEISAKVAEVATDRTDNAELHQSFYTVRVRVDQAALRHAGLQLRAGMPAEVHIATGMRSMLSYVTKPLRDQFARAFRDN